MELQPLVIRTADHLRSGLNDRALRRRSERGELERLVRGSYLDASLWSALSPRSRYVARIHAVVSRLTGPITISHWAAAAVWGLPVPDSWPDRAQVIDPRRSTGQATRTLQRLPGSVPATDRSAWEGLWVTSAARTAADLALSSPFAHAVLVLDQGLHFGLFTKEEVAERLAVRPTARRRRSAAGALAFASEKAEYPGESFSRVAMSEQGFLVPTLQQSFSDPAGLVGRVDFWWESVGVVGEFDGDWKYTDERFLRGRTPAEAFTDEKRRQARLEMDPRVRRVVRWDYPVARSPTELARRLLAAGVPRLGASPRSSSNAHPPEWSASG